MLRRIIEIDQEKCNGCGACAAACHEGAIGMVDGKARLLRDDYCDGLGDCLPTCPTGAITFVEREAAPYDEAAVQAKKAAGDTLPCGCPGSMTQTLRPAHGEPAPQHSPVPHGREGSAPRPVSHGGGCPGSMAQALAHEAPAPLEEAGPALSCLSQWPVQIKLVPVEAPFFQGAKLLIAADCTGRLPPPLHGPADHPDRLPQAGRGGLRGKAHGDHPPQRHPGGHRGTDGCALLRRHPAGRGNGSAQQREVHSLASGDTGPGWKYSGLKET